MIGSGGLEMNTSDDSAVLSSWKDIAQYLGKGVRTVQRWERHLGLPVRRPTGATQKSAVVVHRGDLDAWLASRFATRTLLKDLAKDSQSCLSARSTLKEDIQTSRELRAANRLLLRQIIASTQLLRERCHLMSAQRLEKPWSAEEPVRQEPAPVSELMDGSQSNLGRMEL